MANIQTIKMVNVNNAYSHGSASNYNLPNVLELASAYYCIGICMASGALDPYLDSCSEFNI